MIEVTEITDEIDAELWQQVQVWLLEAEEFERAEVAAMNTPENDELFRRIVAEAADAERRWLEFENSPERMAEMAELLRWVAAMNDGDGSEFIN